MKTAVALLAALLLLAVILLTLLLRKRKDPEQKLNNGFVYVNDNKMTYIYKSKKGERKSFTYSKVE